MRKVIGIMALTAGILICQGAYALTIDLWSQFPDTQGGNGIYAYARNNGNGNLRLLEHLGPYYFGTPRDVSIPYLQKSGNPWITGYPSDTEDPLLGWTIPETNTYSIAGTFNDWGDGGQVYVYLLLNNQTTLWSYTLSSGSISYNLPNLNLQAGDMVYFGINYAGSISNDTTRFSSSITYTPYVPEPISLITLGMGLLGFGIFRKKRNI